MSKWKDGEGMQQSGQTVREEKQHVVVERIIGTLVVLKLATDEVLRLRCCSHKAKCWTLFDATPLSHKSAAGKLPIHIKGEFCSGDISLLLLPRQFGIIIQRGQHNEKNSSHEVIPMARGSASAAKREVGARRAVAIGGVKYSHIRLSQCVWIVHTMTYLQSKKASH